MNCNTTTLRRGQIWVVSPPNIPMLIVSADITNLLGLHCTTLPITFDASDSPFCVKCLNAMDQPCYIQCDQPMGVMGSDAAMCLGEVPEELMHTVDANLRTALGLDVPSLVRITYEEVPL